MTLIADFLMIAGTFGVAVYCYVLAARLKKFATLETGMGGAIAVLSAQVDDMTKALDRARFAASGSAESLGALTGRAESVAGRLEVLLASMHGLPDPQTPARAEVEPTEFSDRKLRFVRSRPNRIEPERSE